VKKVLGTGWLIQSTELSVFPHGAMRLQDQPAHLDRRTKEGGLNGSGTVLCSWYMSDQNAFVVGFQAGQPQVGDIHNLKIAHLEIIRLLQTFCA